MKLREAIEFIENFEIPERLNKAKESIKKSLSELKKENFEEIGTHFYYLLRVILRGHILFETDTAKYFYRKMQKNFSLQEKRYKEQLEKCEHKDIVKIQIDVFYQMMERYFSSLEVIYDKKDFFEARQRAFNEKMRYRKDAQFFRKQYIKYLGYKFMEVSSNYGTSFYRWGVTSLVFILIFASIFALLSFFSPTLSSSGPYDFIHFSVATFTTLGYGDVAPISILGKIIANIEVFTGFIMLGILIGLVQKKFL